MSQSKAFVGIVALLPRLRRFALVLARSPDAADDLVQATCERALIKIDQWEQGSRLDRWVFRIMKTVWLNGRRSAALRQTENIDDHLDQRSVDGIGAADAKLTLAEVRAAFDKLPEGQRQALFLVGIEGYTYQEASELLDVPVSTLVGRLVRGRATLMANEPSTGSNNVAIFRPKAH